MGTLIKIFLWFIGIVALVLVVAAIAIAFVFDPNDYKSQIERMVQSKTGRELKIAGDIQLSLFPWLGLDIGRVSLGNAPGFGESPLASAERMEIRVRPLPLVQKQVETGTITIHGLLLNLVRNKSGKANWENLIGSAKPESGGAAPEPAKTQTKSEVPLASTLTIGGLDIQDARVDWNDEAAGQHYTVDKLSLQTGVIVPGAPTALEMKFQVAGGSPPVTGDVALEGVVNANPSEQRITVRDLKLNANTKGGPSPIAADLILASAVQVDLGNQTLQASSLDLKSKIEAGAPPVILDSILAGELDGNLSTQTYQVQNLTLKGKISGQTLPSGSVDLTLGADTKVDLEQETLSITDLRLETLGTTLSGMVAGENLLARPRFKGTMEVASFNPRQFLERLGQAPPQTANAGVLGKGSLKAEFTASAKSVSLDPLTVQVDDTTVQGSLGILDVSGPALRFDLVADAIDLDRYLPPPARQASTPEKSSPAETPTTGSKTTAGPDLEPLRNLDIDGRLRIGTVKVNKLTLSDVTLPLQARNGMLHANPVAAKLYEGSFQGKIGLDATGPEPRISLEETLTGVQISPLLQDLRGKDWLAGTAYSSAKLTMQGATEAALRGSLSGTSRFSFRDGALKGINIGRLIREAIARIKGTPLLPEAGPLETDFTELSATINLANGMASNDDLLAKSPLLRVRGSGSANLVQERLDYILTATLINTPEGQGGKELKELQGVDIPIKISGTFTQPNIALDVEGILKAKAEALAKQKEDEIKQEVRKRVEEKLQKQLPNEAQELLKKFF